MTKLVKMTETWDCVCLFLPVPFPLKPGWYLGQRYSRAAISEALRSPLKPGMENVSCVTKAGQERWLMPSKKIKKSLLARCEEGIQDPPGCLHLKIR